MSPTVRERQEWGCALLRMESWELSLDEVIRASLMTEAQFSQHLGARQVHSDEMITG